MAKFPERDEFIKQVVECALDDFEYCGRTIREWVALITSTDDELIRDRDEWKQRAEAAEKALQEMQARVEQIEVIRTFDSGMSDDFRKFLKRWIRDDIGEMIDGKNLIQITERPIDEHDSEMRGTVLILRPVEEGEENA